MGYYYHNSLRISAIVLVYNLLTNAPCRSQIIPDSTLPNNTSIKLENNTRIIDKGTTVGGNLFHSFKEFSIPTGSTAYFNNSMDIENIIGRVTSNSASSIDGLIRANGSANLFLINPNGIVFGQNAQLNIGGSFISSTANSIKFADGFQFTGRDSQTTPILTISTPIGLQFANNSEAIRVEGIGHSVIGSRFSPAVGQNASTGLRVQPTKTIALVGGNVILNGGIITAESGRVELGSVGKNSLVNLIQTSSGWNLSYENTASFQDIQLSKRALVNASGVSSGSIQIQGQKITLTDGSVILIQNQGLLPGGTLQVNASDSLDISGTDPVAKIAGSLRNETIGLGKSGDIEISTTRLILRDGGQINSLTFSPANSGNIIINATDSVNLVGVSPLNSGVFSLITAGTFGSGNAGNIVVSTQRLIATGGGAIGSSTLGTGRGGDVTINATDSVMVEGYAPITFQPSILSATTLNAGNAGNLTVNTSRLIVRDGGRIDSSTLASGDSGSVTINASNSIDIKGVPSSQNPSLVISSANIESQIIRNLFGLPPIPSGNSGNIAINTPLLNITGNALITVRNDGLGNAGSIQVNANEINITNNGGISATTAIGEGGDIAVQSNILQLNNGTISATAGQQGTNGDGGNITINTDILLAIKNSSITANAFEGKGGNIQVNTQALLLSPDSTIIASSQRGINGTVEINAQDTNPSQSRLEPQAIAQTPEIVSLCQGHSGEVASSFVNTGTGGLPASSVKQVYSSPGWQRDFVQANDNLTVNEEATKIVEAQGWIRNSKGDVVLTAEANPIVSPYPSVSDKGCHAELQLNKNSE
ncbi:two-partner secretion domain-containing protein [Nostoc sp. UIC 10890]